MSDMRACEVSVTIPASWGRHVRTVVIAIVIVIAIAYGVDLPLPRV